MAGTATMTGTTAAAAARKHKSIHTLQEIMSADETLTGKPPRVPGGRLPGGRSKQRGVVAGIEGIGSETAGEEQPPRRRRRKSDFDVWKDEITQRKAGGPSETPIAIDSSPVSLKGPSPKSYQSKQNGRPGRTKDIEALEREYLGEGRRKIASPITERTEDEESADEEITATIPHPHKHSMSTLLLAHSHPKPSHTPLPRPPLSLLHRKFASIDSSPQPALTPHTPVLPTRKPAARKSAIDPSPLQQMRAFRAHFDSLLPSPPPTTRQQPPPSSPPLRRPPPSSPPTHHQPRRPSPPPTHHQRPATTSLTTKYTFTLPHLPPLTHHSRTAIATLHPTTSHHPGAITLQLRNLAELKGGGSHTYTIPAHGHPITITEHSTGTETTYPLEDLPLKHLTAVRYARHFVDVVKRGTVVGRVEVRERRGGSVWVGRRWGDGRFEVSRDGDDGSGVKVEIKGEGGKRVKILKGGKSIDVDAAGEKYRRLVDRAKRMYAACEKALEDEEEEWRYDDDETEETDLRRKQSENVVPSSTSSDVPDLDKTFQVDSATTFVPSVGWCRRGGTGWWSMLFLDGVRLEIDPSSGDAVWAEKGGEKKMLERGMEMRRVRERVRMFVEQGL